jgi:hypothetical protein
MEKSNIVTRIALLHRSAAEYERGLVQQKDKIRRLRDAGDRTGEAEIALGHLEGYHEALLEAISVQLDRLEKASDGPPPLKKGSSHGCK